MHRTRREKSFRPEAPKPVTATYFGDRLEEYCLCLLLQHAEFKDKAKGLLPEHFERSENSEVFIAWHDASNNDELLNKLDINLQEYLKTLCERVLPPAEEKEQEKALADCLRRLEERRLINLKRQEESFLSDAESEGRNDDIATLQQKGVEINLKLKETFENAIQITSPYREDQ